MRDEYDFTKAKRNPYVKDLPQSVGGRVTSIKARYTHTNLVARDWERLAAFYETVFGCKRVPPARELSGKELAAGTGVPNARIRGVHLRLPGFGESGPTLEIFQYEPAAAMPEPRSSREGGAGDESTPPAVNRPGFGHLAFAVDDVDAARDAVLAAGGSSIGEVVDIEIAGAGRLRFAYVRDPEGNAIELQKWLDTGQG